MVDSQVVVNFQKLAKQKIIVFDPNRIYTTEVPQHDRWNLSFEIDFDVNGETINKICLKNSAIYELNITI